MARGLISLFGCLAINIASAAPPALLAIDDWVLEVGPDYRSAYTANQSGSVLGIYCPGDPDKSCYMTLISDVTCEDGAISPLLLNSDQGAFHITAKCSGVTGAPNNRTSVNIFIESAQISSALNNGLEVGIALPMASGKFKVMRFSAKGASSAIERARQNPAAQKTTPQAKKSKDEFM